MNTPVEFLSPAKAARRLNVSPKALRLYERRGLLAPGRTTAGWRAYGPEEMVRAGEIVALRALGLGLAQIARVIGGDPRHLEAALAIHRTELQTRLSQVETAVTGVRERRTSLADGRSPSAAEVHDPLDLDAATAITFDLPWPWGGERFALRSLKPITYLTGPLGSGKTRLALRLAETVPGAAFVALDRAANGAAAARTLLKADPALADRVDRALAELVANGAADCDALLALLTALEAKGPSVLVIDMIEQGLNAATQAALIGDLRRRGAGARPLVLMTRSNLVLDLAAVGADEAILYCPANHSPPIYVLPHAGAPGFDAVATCLASPDVRARTQGLRAVLDTVA